MIGSQEINLPEDIQVKQMKKYLEATDFLMIPILQIQFADTA